MPEIPTLSQITRMLRTPETQFESVLRSMGFSLPKGPQSYLLDVQTNIEASEAPTPPAGPGTFSMLEGLELPRVSLPTLPTEELPSDSSTSSSEEEPTEQPPAEDEDKAHLVDPHSKEIYF